MAELSPPVSRAAQSFEAALTKNTAAARHLKRVSYEGREWVERTYPAQHHRGILPGDMLPSEQAALDLIEAYEAETARLKRDYELQTPVTYSKPVQRGDGWYVQSLVELVDGEPFAPYWNWDRQTQNLKHAARLAVNLTNYYTDVVAYKQQTYVGDLCDLGQYIATPSAVRVDMDPILWDTEYLPHEIRRLGNWAQSLPTGLVPESLPEYIGSLVVTLAQQ